MSGLISRRRFGAAAVSALGSIAFGVPVLGTQVQWKWAHDFSADYPINVRGIEAFAKVRKDTNGQFDIKAFPNSVLGDDPSMLQQLRVGAIDMLSFPGTVLDTIIPVASIEGVAFAYPSRKTPLEAMDGELGAHIREQIEAKGMVAFERVFDLGWRQFTTSTKPIHTVEDLGGLKLMTANSRLRIDTFRSLGCNPTPVPTPQRYTSMQTHLVDGQETSLLVTQTQHIYEVQKYCSMTNHIWSSNWSLVNAGSWAAIPKEFQQILHKRMNEAVTLQRHDNALLEISTRDKLEREGLIFNDAKPASFKAKLVASGFYERWQKEYGEKAWGILEKYCGKLA